MKFSINGALLPARRPYCESERGKRVYQTDTRANREYGLLIEFKNAPTCPNKRESGRGVFNRFKNLASRAIIRANFFATRGKRLIVLSFSSADLTSSPRRDKFHRNRREILGFKSHLMIHDHSNQLFALVLGFRRDR